MALLPIDGYPHNGKFDDSMYGGDPQSCVAFCKFVYGELWGDDTGDSIKSGTSISNITEGSWLRTEYNGGRHDLIVGTQTATEVYVYDANFLNYGSGNPYTVRYAKISKSLFGANKSYVIKGGTMAP